MASLIGCFRGVGFLIYTLFYTYFTLLFYTTVLLVTPEAVLLGTIPF